MVKQPDSETQYWIHLYTIAYYISIAFVDQRDWTKKVISETKILILTV